MKPSYEQHELRADLTVSGMFRSGTTLLSRMLGSTGEALVVSDPLVYFFKAYRNHHLRAAGVTGWHPDEPTSDGFRSPWPEVDRAIAEGDLSEPVCEEDLAKLRADLVAWKGEQHPRLAAAVERITGQTFADVYRRLLALLRELYAGPDCRLMGVKVSWCEEFLPALARAFPEMRFVLVLRDLRAIVASQNSQRVVGVGKRPLLFYVRHWRKSVAHTILFSRHDEALRERVRVVRYEDLVCDPAAELGRLCAFLGLRFDAAMTDPSRYRSVDESGPWRANSAFEVDAQALYADSLERWREVLTSDEVRILESLAGPELAACGYALSAPPLSPLACLELDGEPAPEELAPWIREFDCCRYLTDEGLREAEFLAEDHRRAMIEGAGITLPGERSLVRDERVLEELRTSWQSVVQAA